MPEVWRERENQGEVISSCSEQERHQVFCCSRKEKNCKKLGKKLRLELWQLAWASLPRCLSLCKCGWNSHQMQPWLSQTAVSPGCNSSGTLTRLPTSSSLSLKTPSSPSPAVSLPQQLSARASELRMSHFGLGARCIFISAWEKNGRGSAGSQERLLN